MHASLIAHQIEPIIMCCTFQRYWTILTARVNKNDFTHFLRCPISPDRISFTAVIDPLPNLTEFYAPESTFVASSGFHHSSEQLEVFIENQAYQLQYFKILQYLIFLDVHQLQRNVSKRRVNDLFLLQTQSTSKTLSINVLTPILIKCVFYSVYPRSYYV